MSSQLFWLEFQHPFRILAYSLGFNPCPFARCLSSSTGFTLPKKLYPLSNFQMFSYSSLKDCCSQHYANSYFLAVLRCHFKTFGHPPNYLGFIKFPHNNTSLVPLVLLLMSVEIVRFLCVFICLIGVSFLCDCRCSSGNSCIHSVHCHLPSSASGTP